MHPQLSKAQTVSSLKVWANSQTFWSPIVLQSIKNSSQRHTAALTWNDKHKTVYTSYKCYFWWQWGIKTKLKAKGGGRDLACDQNACLLVLDWKKWDAHDKSATASTAVLKSNGENSTTKTTITDHRGQTGASVWAVVLQTRLLTYLYCLWTVITWGSSRFF